MATVEDRKYNLDVWAKVFGASTWEELKELSEKNVFMREAAKSMYVMTAEEEIRERMIERQENEAIQRYHKNRADKAETELKKAKSELDNTKLELDNTREMLAEKDMIIKGLQDQISGTK